MLHPYNYTREDDLRYAFTTDEGVSYVVYFLDYSFFFESRTGIYSFNIEMCEESETAHKPDVRIAHTVVSILKQFFRVHTNSMLMVCDSTDGRAHKRKILFERWYRNYNDGSIEKVDASFDTGDYMLYASLFVHKSNPDKASLAREFFDLVRNNMTPLF